MKTVELMNSLLLVNSNLFQVEGELKNQEVNDTVSLKCPHCQHLGSFATATKNGLVYLKEHKNRSVSYFIASIRICPNNQCKGILLVITNNGKVLKTTPPQLLGSQPVNLPPSCKSILEEAIACHAAGAYRAAAMMVRRLLEEICELNHASGKDLHTRLEVLKKTVMLPSALYDAMFELKALGNDAAHIKAKAYDNIGAEEAEDSIELAKEILKSMYQMQALVERLQARKKIT